MKLLSLNIWGATKKAELFAFLTEQAKSTDFFCFQEVLDAPEQVAATESRGIRVHLFRELQTLLPDFQGFFAPSHSGYDFEGPVDFDLAEGLAIFAKRGFNAADHQHNFIASEQVYLVKRNVILQQLNITHGEKQFSLFNFHGVSQPGDKLDTPERLEQSAKVKKIIDSVAGPKVLCGDFNLMPQTRSITVLENGLKNLIKDFQIKSTRNTLSQAMYPGDPQHFADYVFVSPDVEVKSFKVPYNEVSDHLPMVLVFSL